MGMTIDKAIGVLETCQYILSNQVGSNWCKSKYDAVTIAINTMRKYQKIEQVLNDWREMGYNENDGLYTLISGVVEDGNENNHYASNS